MDCPEAPEDLLFRTLDHFRFSNLWFARYRTILSRALLPRLRAEREREHRVADLGAGGGDIARWLAVRCRRERLRVRIFAVERDPRILRYAREANAGFPEIELVEADALNPAAWGEPDFVFANHLLHHLADEAVVELLRRLDTVRAAYALSDIERSGAAIAPYAVMAGLFFRSSFVLEDGLISIRRSFTKKELLHLIAEAALRRPPRVRRLLPFRLVLESP